MITTILLCAIVISFVEMRYRMKLGMRHAENRSANIIGGTGGAGSDIDQHYGTDKIMPRLLFITFLVFLLYFTWGQGPSLSATRAYVLGQQAAPERSEERHLAPEPEVAPEKPYKEDQGGMIVNYHQDYVHLANVKVAEDAGRPRNYNAPKRERLAEEATTTRREVDMAQFRREVPSGGGSSYWLKTVTGDEMTVRKLRKAYRTQVDRVEHEWIPEQAFYRVYWGPFRSESEARTFRDRTPGCNCDIVPR